VYTDYELSSTVHPTSTHAVLTLCVLMCRFVHMRFDKFYKAMTTLEREAYAKRVGTSRKYFDNHLIVKPSRRVTPRRDRLLTLAKESDGKCSLIDVIEYFHRIEQKIAS